MGKLNVVIDDKLDEQFRGAIFRAKGLKKGVLTEAIEEAIVLWIKTQTEEKRELLKTKAV